MLRSNRYGHRPFPARFVPLVFAWDLGSVRSGSLEDRGSDMGTHTKIFTWLITAALAGCGGAQGDDGETTPVSESTDATAAPEEPAEESVARAPADAAVAPEGWPSLEECNVLAALQANPRALGRVGSRVAFDRRAPAGGRSKPQRSSWSVTAGRAIPGTPLPSLPQRLSPPPARSRSQVRGTSPQ